MAASATSRKRTRSASRSGVGEPPSKRTRSETTSKVDEIYLVDPELSKIKGDIYLKIGNTLFPAHLQKLRNVQGLFADLFSIQQPEHADLIHGLPYCDMFNCSESQLRVLLKLIHGAKHVFQRKTALGITEFNVENILDALLISSRLDLPGIRTQAKDAIYEFIRAMWIHIVDGVPPPEHPVIALTGYTMSKDSALSILSFRMINVFKECEVEYCMPIAYYLAAQQTHNDIWDGVKLPDGSLLELDLEDKKKVLKGREMLRSMRRNVTFRWLIEHAGQPKDYVQLHGCTSEAFPKGKGCYDFVFDLYTLFYSPTSRLLEDRCDALDSVSFQANETIKGHLCPKCHVYFNDRIIRCLQASWSEIAKIFTGRSWGTLRERQNRIEDSWYESLS
ncbi:hypothetical protein J3R30DRAFT_3450513 [Lentinula aciculospora]|uniref:BTB domain-containing protein n=1 Tax=Lentinula aciculospora TaxID=153920 RepID=A0A9W8ZWI6_9AGAR|nr:hypothetical protein J3R30DRAFT_3561006 [Lentinula aciculospora]KAJ4483668.1 hypothetical protein J3R30DRAFT_3450513 [Lentinula aciculospora]